MKVQYTILQQSVIASGPNNTIKMPFSVGRHL